MVDHGSGPLRVSPRPLALASLVYERVATAALKRLSARFFGVSRASTDWLREFGIFDAEIVPNGIAPRPVVPTRNRDTFDQPTVFFAGRLLPEKGVRELVDAVELLVREGNNVRLRIAGEGPLSPILEKRVSTTRSSHTSGGFRRTRSPRNSTVPPSLSTHRIIPKASQRYFLRPPPQRCPSYPHPAGALQISSSTAELAGSSQGATPGVSLPVYARSSRNPTRDSEGVWDSSAWFKVTMYGHRSFERSSR